MFELVNVDKTRLHETLRRIGKKVSYSPNDWRADRPTIGCCAAVSSMIYCYHPIQDEVVPIQLKPNGGSHWILGLPVEEIQISRAKDDGYIVVNIDIGGGKKKPHIIVDLTADQTDENFDYEIGKRRAFMHPSPSKRTKLLAEAFGYNSDAPRKAGHFAAWKKDGQ